MGTVSLRMSVEPRRVFEVLADGWQYTGWVVGASHVRAVEATWPSVGARIHHSFGVWPLVLKDETTVEACEPSTRLVLLANGRPLGQARVELTLSAEGDGTRVVMEEHVVQGPGKAIPAPVMDALIKARNREALARLAALAEQPVQPHE
jgi:hypothetical protein